MSKNKNVLVDPINRVGTAGRNQLAETIKVDDKTARRCDSPIKFNIPTITNLK